MRITESRLRRVIREVIIESLKDDLNVDQSSMVADIISVNREIGIINYCNKVLDKLSRMGYTMTFVDDNTMMIREPIQIGKSSRDLVNVRDIIIRCFDDKEEHALCVNRCVDKWEEINRYK